MMISAFAISVFFGSDTLYSYLKVKLLNSYLSALSAAFLC